MTHEELEEAVPLYAIGALERSERQAIEAHLLSGCAACHATLKDYQTVASLLPFGLTPATPPNTLKAKIMMAPASTSGQPETEQPSPRSSLEPGEWMNHLFPPITPARSLPFLTGYRHFFLPLQQSFTTRRPSSLTRDCWIRVTPIVQYSQLLPPVGVWTVFQFQCGWSSSQTSYLS